MKTEEAIVKKQQIGFGKAVIVFVFVITSILLSILVFESSAHIPLVLSSAFAAGIGASSGFKWKDMEAGISDTIKASAPALLIMLIIGMIIGTWILAGIVPTMIYYGLKILSPSIFLLATCLICSVVSVVTGSSWSTMGTVGVALMGVGIGLGVPSGMTAGAIISGAYFGDKMSPLSDTTNLAPAMAGTDLFTHIKHMSKTTGPSYIAALILYGLLGISFAGKSIDTAAINTYLVTLRGTFTITPWLLIPPVCVLLMVIKKIPAIPGLIGISLLGCIFAGIFQGSGISAMMASAYTGFQVDTGVEVIDKLLNRGGLSSMLDTVALIMIALTFAGIVESTGMIQTIVDKILLVAKSDAALLTATIFTTLFTNFATGVQYVAIVLPGRMFRKTYRERGLHPKNLSRILEDVGTLCAPFCPWSTDGAFILATLGVGTGTYAPFMFLAIINPLVSLLCAWTGWSITKITPEQAAQDIIS